MQAISGASIFFEILLSVAVSGNESIYPFITNGVQADRRSFPFMVGLDIYNTAGWVWCGGSLISNQWILTAAHCMDSLSRRNIDVHLGAYNRMDHREQGRQRISVPTVNVVVHEKWSAQTLKNDIALIKLPKPVNFNEYIQRIKLPKLATSLPTYAGQFGIAAGWGYTSANSNDPTDVLRWIQVPIMANKACKKSWPGWVHDSNICINTKGGKATCFADSGGPLFVVVSNEPTQVGITSFGKEKCDMGEPAVFTRVTSFLGWIKRKTGIVH